VHPKDKQEEEEITDCVYKIPCGNCEKTYTGETGRKFGTRLEEHKTEATTNLLREVSVYPVCRNKVSQL